VAYPRRGFHSLKTPDIDFFIALGCREIKAHGDPEVIGGWRRSHGIFVGRFVSVKGVELLAGGHHNPPPENALNDLPSAMPLKV